MATAPFSTAAQAEDLVFTLTNGTSSVLMRVYTAPFGVDSWEGDVFGEHVPEPGASVQLTLANGPTQCEYDIRFEIEEGSGLDAAEDSQNLCELGSYTVHD